MWITQKTDDLYEDTMQMVCRAHREEATKLSYYKELVKLGRNIFRKTKVDVMAQQLHWSNSGIDVESIFCRNMNQLEAVEDTFQITSLHDSVSTFILAKLFKVCYVCEKVQTKQQLVSFYNMLFFKNALGNRLEFGRNFENSELAQEIREHFSGCEKLIDKRKYNFFKFLNVLCFVSQDRFLRSCIDAREEMDLMEGLDESMEDDTKDELRIFLRNAGNAEYGAGNYEMAVRHYTHCLLEGSLDYHLFGNRAQAYLKMNKFQRAELDCRAALMLRPDWCKGYYRLAQAVAGRGKVHAAHQICDFGSRQCEPSSHLDTLVAHGENLKKDCDVCKRTAKKAAEKKEELVKNKGETVNASNGSPQNLLNEPENAGSNLKNNDEFNSDVKELQHQVKCMSDGIVNFEKKLKEKFDLHLSEKQDLVERVKSLEEQLAHSQQTIAELKNKSPTSSKVSSKKKKKR